MNEKLLQDYIKEQRRDWQEGSTFVNIRTVGGLVLFTLQSPCGHYNYHEEIELLDLIAWVYCISS